MKGQGSKTGKQWALEKQRGGKDGFSQFDCRILLSASAKPEVIFSIYGYYHQPIVTEADRACHRGNKGNRLSMSKIKEKKMGVKEEWSRLAFISSLSSSAPKLGFICLQRIFTNLLSWPALAPTREDKSGLYLARPRHLNNRPDQQKTKRTDGVMSLGHFLWFPLWTMV